MTAFLSALDAAWQFLTVNGSKVFNAYITVPILAGVLAVWILDRIFGIFKLIKG